MRKLLPFFLLIVFPQLTFSQVIPCNCECSGRLELVSGNGFYLLDSITYKAWDDNTGDWRNISVSIYRYDELFRKVGNTGYRIDPVNGERVPSFNIDYRYGDRDVKTGYLHYRWNETSAGWDITQRIDLGYDNNQKITSQKILKPAGNGSRWDTAFRATYRYDVMGYDEVFEKETWDPETGTWQKIFRTNYIKDSPSTTAISFTMKDGTWVPVSRTISVTNDQGVLTETTHDQYDPDDMEWRSLSSATYYFDDKGNKTEWISRGEDHNTKKDIIRGHQRYLYDDEGKLSEVLSVRENATTKTEQYPAKRVYHWSLHSVSGLQGKLSGSFKIFPNPFKYYTTVALPETAERIDILDSQGRVVRSYSDITAPTLQIDKRELRPAIYFIKVYGKKVYTARMVIY